jgi:hypothetical protein
MFDKEFPVSKSKFNDMWNSRAVEDQSQSAIYARLCAQLLFAANGGAALAIMSFATNVLISSSPSSSFDVAEVLQSFRLGAVLYLCGVTCVIISALCASVSKYGWGVIWEVRARHDLDAKDSIDGTSIRRRVYYRAKVGAVVLHYFSLSALAASIASFVAGSYFTTIAFQA